MCRLFFFPSYDQQFTVDDVIDFNRIDFWNLDTTRMLRIFIFT